MDDQVAPVVDEPVVEEAAEETTEETPVVDEPVVEEAAEETTEETPVIEMGEETPEEEAAPETEL